MASRLNPYIQFENTAREAMEFYASVLGGTPEVMTFGNMGAEGPEKDLVMHSFLETDDGHALMAADTPPGMDVAQPSRRITISISGDDDKLRDQFAGLSAGGTVITPLAKQAWGDEFGGFTDKYGVEWLFNIGSGES
ncbi:3-demethylubiquinone-9 3-methyltransferase [Nocardioides sp. Soil797]|nr:3-demethylubiquinone-9 3-methyltransferase [Nocardioides sp. Soil797]